MRKRGPTAATVRVLALQRRLGPAVAAASTVRDADVTEAARPRNDQRQDLAQSSKLILGVAAHDNSGVAAHDNSQPTSSTRSSSHKSRLASSGSLLSTLPLKADIRQRIQNVCFVPLADA